MPQDRVCDCGQVMTVGDPTFEGRLRCPRCGREVVFAGPPPTPADLPLPEGLPPPRVEEPAAEAVEPERPAGEPPPTGPQPGHVEPGIPLTPLPGEVPKEPADAPVVSARPVAIDEESPPSLLSLLVRLLIKPTEVAPALADRLDRPSRVAEALLVLASSVPVTVLVVGLLLSPGRRGMAAVAAAVVAGLGYRLISFMGQVVVGHLVGFRTTRRGDFTRAVGALALLNGMLGWIGVVLIPVVAGHGVAVVWLRRVVAMALYAVFVRAGEPLLAAVYGAREERFLWAPAACALVDAVVAAVVLGLLFGGRL